MLERLVGQAEAARRTQIAGQAALRVVDGATDDRRDLFVGERLQAKDPDAREQRGVHLEVGVLRRGADEGHRAVFNVREKRVLLGLVEAVYFVDEEDGLLAVEDQLFAGFGHEGADFGDTVHDGRVGRESGAGRVGQDAGEAGLAAAGWTPQEKRAQAAALEGPSQRASFADQLLVADDFIDVAWTHSRRQGLTRRRWSEDVLLPAEIAGGRLVGAASCHGLMLQRARAM